MRLNRVRIAIVVAIATFLFIFFVPLVPFTTQVNCSLPSGAPIPTDCFATGGAYDSGYHSIGFQIAGWGASGTPNWWVQGYSPPLIADGPCNGGGCYLTSYGVLFTLVAPLLVVSSLLLGPEIVRLSRWTRAGFAATGAGSMVFALIIMATLFLSRSLDIDLALAALFLAPVGCFMVGYSVMFKDM